MPYTHLRQKKKKNNNAHILGNPWTTQQPARNACPHRENSLVGTMHPSNHNGSQSSKQPKGKRQFAHNELRERHLDSRSVDMEGNQREEMWETLGVNWRKEVLNPPGDDVGHTLVEPC